MLIWLLIYFDAKML